MKIQLFLILMLLTCSGCSTIMCGSEKTISIQSTPVAASFEIEDASGRVIAHGVTPNTVTLKRGGGWFKQAGYTIWFERDGYEPVGLPIKQKMEVGWYLGGNAIVGGLIGWIIVDPLTGAMWTIEDVQVYLPPMGRRKSGP